jgi:excisionase family DNA binding protein
MTLLDPGITGRKLPDDRLFGKPELARFLGLSASGLNKLLDGGRGPASYRIGRLVRFRLDDVEQWLDEQRKSSNN